MNCVKIADFLVTNTEPKTVEHRHGRRLGNDEGIFSDSLIR